MLPLKKCVHRALPFRLDGAPQVAVRTKGLDHPFQDGIGQKVHRPIHLLQTVHVAPVKTQPNKLLVSGAHDNHRIVHNPMREGALEGVEQRLHDARAWRAQPFISCVSF